MRIASAPWTDFECVCVSVLENTWRRFDTTMSVTSGILDLAASARPSSDRFGVVFNFRMARHPGAIRRWDLWDLGYRDGWIKVGRGVFGTDFPERDFRTGTVSVAVPFATLRELSLAK